MTHAQIITTIAGSGTYGFSGDGGPAIAAQLSYISGVAVDAAGNIYIADMTNNRIRKVSTSGIMSTVAGTGIRGYSGDGGDATAAQLNNPNGVVVDVSGNLYIVDLFSNRIRKVNTAGIITTIAGNGSAGYSGDGGPATAATLNGALGVAVDAAGNVYIGDTYNHRVRKVGTSGIITTIAGVGVPGYSGDGGSTAVAAINSPWAVAVDAIGNVYISDQNNHRIRKVSTSGIISTIAGTGVAGYTGDSRAATTAAINYPHGIAVDSSGNVYIADFENHRIRKVSTSGIISTIAGTGSAGYYGDGGAATAAHLNNPIGVVSARGGDVYIADADNIRIRKITLSATSTLSVAGGAPRYCYPNPTNGMLTIEIPVEEATITINDMSGKVINTLQASSSKVQIDLTAYSHGNYVVTVTNGATMWVHQLVVSE